MPKISELTAGTAPTGVETFPSVQGSVTVSLTLNQVYAATKTLTNTTYDTAGSGNSFSINGLAATANTGTGSVARATSPTLTSPTLVTPTLGAALATSINGNTFTSGTYTLTGAAGKTFTFSNTLTLAGTDSTTITFQGTDTYVGRATTDTLTNKTLTSPTLTTPIISTISNTGTITLPTSTDTLVGKATTDTLTNKTFDTAGTGNSFSINGVAATANTGTGAVARASSPAFTTPDIGVATGTSLAATGAVTSSGTAGVGYATGAGGTITQITNRSTGVTLDKRSGAITLVSQVNSATSAATQNVVVVTNSTVAATDTIIFSQKSGTDKYLIYVTAVGAGSFTIAFYVPTGGTTNEAPVFNFNVIKGVAA